MTETLQLEEAVQFYDAPKFLIEWCSPWQEFVTSIRPALGRSGTRLAGEAPVGLFPYRNMLVSLLVEAFLVFVVIAVDVKMSELHPYIAPRLEGHEVIYYSGDELPRTEDLGGAQAGTSGRAGGRTGHHRTQTMKVARGGSLVPRVVDAPDLKLPASHDNVANLLAIKPNAGPPPLEGMQSARSALSLPTSVVAPAPALARDYSRGTLSLGSVIPPAPSVARDQTVSAPALNPNVIAPAPSVSRENALVAPALGTTIVAPAPSVSRDKSRSAPALSASVIAPAPATVSREISRAPVQMNDMNVVPPPVSAPERDTARTSGPTLPAPAIIAPPPSANAASDLHRLASGAVKDPFQSIVPPPPTQVSGGSLMNSVAGTALGLSQVVPPPPNVMNGGTHGGSGTSLATNVVPPPPNATGSLNPGNPRGTPGGTGNVLNPGVVPPPPAVGAASAQGGRAAITVVGSASVVPPPPTVSGTDRGSGNSAGTTGGPGGTLLASNVVPPPPSLGRGSAESGSGRGFRGAGLGSPLDSGSAVAPPAGGGSGGGNSGVLLSNDPGSKVGMPANGGKGSLALSPAGGDKPGLGGTGDSNSGIGRGNGPGSGMTGEGTGAGKTGAGRGSDPNAHGGISPTSGPGGAGSGTSGAPAVPGASVQGGSSSNIVNLPSFGSDGGSGPPSVPGRSSVREQKGPDITIFGTSTSGGALNIYGKLPGDNYSVYVYTTAGTVVMQYTDPSAAPHSHSGSLTGPQRLRTDLPPGLPRARLLVACTLDASGNLKNLRVLEAGPADMTAKIVAALHGWKFRPAMRGNQPVEVTAILGFGIDTNDHF